MAFKYNILLRIF